MMFEQSHGFPSCVLISMYSWAFRERERENAQDPTRLPLSANDHPRSQPSAEPPPLVPAQCEASLQKANLNVWGFSCFDLSYIRSLVLARFLPLQRPCHVYASFPLISPCRTSHIFFLHDYHDYPQSRPSSSYLLLVKCFPICISPRLELHFFLMSFRPRVSLSFTSLIGFHTYILFAGSSLCLSFFFTFLSTCYSLPYWRENLHFVPPPPKKKTPSGFLSRRLTVSISP